MRKQQRRVADYYVKLGKAPWAEPQDGEAAAPVTGKDLTMGQLSQPRQLGAALLELWQSIGVYGRNELTVEHGIPVEVAAMWGVAPPRTTKDIHAVKTAVN